MTHPDNSNWPDGYKPTGIEIHMNFARLIAESINADIIVGTESLLTAVDILDECATFGILLSPDFEGVSNYSYLAALVSPA